MKTVLRFIALLLLLVGVTLAGGYDQKYVFEGTMTGDSYGYSVSDAGDVNADGHPDVIVASAVHGDYASYAGLIHVFSGEDGSTLHTFEGKTYDDHMGRVVACAGDVNADGYDDILVGGWRESSPRKGLAWVFSGKDGKTLYSLVDDDDSFGDRAAGAGDVNKDGYDDFIVSAFAADGAVGWAAVYSGKDGSRLYKVSGQTVSARCGAGVDAAGDVNLDGYADFVVGSRDEKTTGIGYAGAVRVYSGKDGSVLYTWRGESNSDSFGNSVSRAGDVNDDGYPDIVVGAYMHAETDEAAGRVYVFSGKDGKTLYTFDGADEWNLFGFCVSWAGDVNRDGYDDVMAGAQGNDENGYGAGIFYIFSGKDGKVVRSFKGGAKEASLGACVSGVGDINLDGIDDVIAGETGWMKGEAKNVGRAIVYASIAPKGTIQIVGGAVATQSSQVTLAMTWDGVGATIDGMRIRNAGDSWGDWFAPVATKVWALTPGDGVRVVEMEVRADDDTFSGTYEVSIIVDTVAPAGSLTIDDGADFTASDAVSLRVTGTDAGSGASEMRLRNEGEDYGPWVTLLSPHSFSLTPADGVRRVDLQVRDRAGNISPESSDTIFLDTTPPTAVLTINDGTEYTNQQAVKLGIQASDGGSGVDQIRVRNQGTTWTGWRSPVATLNWSVPSEEGPKVVEIEAMDALGNASDTFSATIVLDTIPPSFKSISVNSNEPYVLPEEPLQLGIQASDSFGASGVSGLKVRFTPGGDWSGWYPANEGFSRTSVDHPSAAGSVQVAVILRDAAGNETEPRSATFMRVREGRVTVAGGAKLTGSISPANDVDAMSVLLSRDDVLKAKLATKVKGFELALDLVRPDGTRIALDRYPADAKKPMISGFVAPETGEYLIVLRRAAPGQSTTGAYSLTVTVKQAKANKKVKGEANADGISFEAAAGTILKAKLSGEGLTAAGMTLTGPDGDVPFTVKEKNGKVTILPVALTSGSGTYRLAYGALLPVKHALTLKLPKKVKGVLENN